MNFKGSIRTLIQDLEVKDGWLEDEWDQEGTKGIIVVLGEGKGELLSW